MNFLQVWKNDSAEVINLNLARYMSHHWEFINYLNAVINAVIFNTDSKYNRNATFDDSNKIILRSVSN